jgi:hypothetical protein
MLDVHAPHDRIHTRKEFLIHIAAITIGLLIALGLEGTVEWLHHKAQARHALLLLQQEVENNRSLLQQNMANNDAVEREHRNDLAVLKRVRAGPSSNDEQLVFVRSFNASASAAWKVVHESGAAAYIPYEVMAQFEEIYTAQDMIDQFTASAYVELQRATAVLNTERPDQDREAEDQAERSALSRKFVTHSDATNSRLSGKQDLSTLNSAQLDRLELGFQQALSDDRRIHRLQVYLEWLYAQLPK